MNLKNLRSLTKAACLSIAISGISPTTTFASPGALNFNMTNYVDVGTVLTSGHSYTKEAWIKANGNTSHNIITGGDDPFWLSGNHLRAAHHWQSQPTDLQDTATFPLNVWVHVAVTYDSAAHTMKLYRDGAEVASSNTIGTYFASFEQVGAYNSSNIFDGDMDEVRIWNRALCGTELKQHMNAELRGNETGLLVYYKFNDGLPLLSNLGITSVLDASGNSHNGLLQNFSLLGTAANFVTGITPGTYTTYTPPSASITSAPGGSGATLTANTAASYQWLKNGAWISGANAQTYSATPGVYTVSITAADGCPNTSAPITVAAPNPITGNITVNPNPTVYNQQANTIFDGYGPQTVSLTANATGGSGGYIYTWTPGGAHTKNISVSPSSSTNYTVAISDSFGNSKTLSQLIKVKDVTYGCWILMCHQYNTCWSSGYQTYAVPSCFVPLFLAIGDQLGSCGSGKGVDNAIKYVEKLNFSAYPNPTTGTISIDVPEPGTVDMVITDLSGQVVARQYNESNLEQKVMVDMGNVANGIYFVRLVNNNISYQTKIVKQ